MALPRIASRDEWLAARIDLLAEEKALTRARDALNTKRRELPMVEIDKDYRFTGPEGEVGLPDLFAGRRQLVVVHFMFDPSWEEGCTSCTAGAAERSQGLLEHLAVRDTSLVHVSRAPLPKIERYKAKMGWTFPWYSSYGSDFNHDFHVTLDDGVLPAEYNYRPAAAYGPTWTGDAQPFEMPGLSCFLRDGDRVFHTYSQYARGTESTGGSYYYLDLTALGRQEDWEEPAGRADHVRSNQPDFSS
jgi:predicted dithiol-disulfide oxidoreductase (DUF899 family)